MTEALKDMKRRVLGVSRQDWVHNESHEGNALSDNMLRLMGTVRLRLQRAIHLSAQGLEADARSEIEHARVAFDAMHLGYDTFESAEFSEGEDGLPEDVLDRLEAEGVKIRHWEKGSQVRYYLTQNGRDLGFLVPEDDGSTGTCKGITKRRGFIASILRGD